MAEMASFGKAKYFRCALSFDFGPYEPNLLTLSGGIYDIICSQTPQGDKDFWASLLDL